ncbi:HNH endonuclease [Anaerophilus nitritogenes]|uniref:HNH endonuclease n=1 Tax=Anaerophilus nitritogenes TaxID=2498136 RepID=UPI00101BB965|nr:HNH endonuclease [Anaerophilus nitritogenes]
MSVENIYKDLENGTTEIEIINLKGEHIITKFNTKHLNNVKKYKWYYNKNLGEGYVHGYNSFTGERAYLHRIVMGVENDEDVVDHINRNTLDNRDMNLRIVTSQDNARNRRISIRNSTGVNGVSWDNTYQKYISRICVNYRYINLGYFDDIEDARIARMEAEKEYFGEFAIN